MTRVAQVGFALFVAAIVVLLNVRVHRPGDDEVVAAQLRYLEQALSDGAAERMQQMFPEGRVFTWALYGLASIQLSQSLDGDDPLREELLGRAGGALDMATSAEARATFVDDLEPRYGAFYTSWTLYLAAQYVRAVGVDGVSPDVLEALRSDCARFARALAASETPFLPSYPSAAWPADTAVGVAGLGICRDVIDPSYGSFVQEWVRAVGDRLDPEFGVLTHGADSRTGAPSEGVRGSSLALMSRVLVDADPQFARQQYEALRRHFVAYRFGAPGVLEYPMGTDGNGDVDSGPLVLGYSGPAVVVGAAAAKTFGDDETARVLLGGVELAGFPVRWRGTRRYAGGALPVGDAFIAWARSSPRREAPRSTWSPVFPGWWSLPFHLLSTLFIVGLGWRLRSLIGRSTPAWLSRAEGVTQSTSPTPDLGSR